MPKRGRGRPPKAEPPANAVLAVRLSEREFDRLYQLARRERLTISGLARAVLQELLASYDHEA